MSYNNFKMSENPFRILGLTQALVAVLLDKEIVKLAQAHYRALQMVYHPDRAGSSPRSKEKNQQI